MKCFSGVDVLNALLRKVTIIRLDKVDKEVGDATEAFYNRESGPLATAAPIFTRYRGKGDFRPMSDRRGDLGSPPFVAFSSRGHYV